MPMSFFLPLPPEYQKAAHTNTPLNPGLRACCASTTTPESCTYGAKTWAGSPRQAEKALATGGCVRVAQGKSTTPGKATHPRVAQTGHDKSNSRDAHRAEG